ncbi:hypothetical protein K458DRAFT_393047 [Lentithecium fluviatile CBS 122367]|uniref:Glycogen debranching enzyme n=1 Tax=Lentithecium fluviatile CBS 122367 TaxID=1168545 RepID=A0A6G1IQA2_9PLEO|nr:hypothetical protein K458DRAFT_393047 [Lentithecium fluviatile CBS 122367]
MLTISTRFGLLPLALLSSVSIAQYATTPCDITRLHISEPPYENYFASDCHSASHVIVRSPDTPRLLIAWPSGNSGIAAFFEPENKQKGSLGIHLENSTTTGQTLTPLSMPSEGTDNKNDRVGVSGLIHFDAPALLTLPIIGSIRHLREYTEGGNLNTDVQNAVVTVRYENAGGALKRTWFDNTTEAAITFDTTGSVEPVKIIEGDKWMLRFGTGTYNFTATYNYPQMNQLTPQEVLSTAARGLISQNPTQTTALSFLSYENKILAGTWRFLTYFGRDSMISALLLQPVLSQGENGAIEAVISAVLERINKTDGTVCHEEVIGDYATFVHRAEGKVSTAPTCDYKMVDTDYLLPVLLNNYFIDTDVGKGRAGAFLQKKAAFLAENSGMTYLELAQATAEKVMRTAAPFAANPTIANLIHIKEGESVGNWRDSNNGLGGGKIPYDVNTALVPAGLRAIAALSRAGFFTSHPEWAATADKYAQVWEDSSLQFFHVQVPQKQAQMLLDSYVSEIAFVGPSDSTEVKRDINFYGVSIDNAQGKNAVRVMSTDDCFRHFLLNTTNQEQLSAFMSQTADNILAPFPMGLSTDVGLLVANPAYGGTKEYAQNFKNSDYHGTVVWSWQLAMMAAGLQRQLGRCNAASKPDFCTTPDLHNKILAAYDHLWTLIEKNAAQISGEVWSWKYTGSAFEAVPLSAYSSVESNVQQLWSLTFLAVKREVM